VTAGAVVLPEALRAALTAAATAAHPFEACGLLVGKREGQVVTVTAFHPAENRAPHPADTFLIDPAAHLALQRRLREEPGQSIVGCYHSHPDGKAEPSPRDKSGGQGPCSDGGGWASGFVWIIIATGVNNPGSATVAAFQAPGFVPLPIVMRPPCVCVPSL